MVLMKKVDEETGKVTWIETDKAGEVQAIRKEGEEWKTPGGHWGKTAIGTPTFLKDIPGGITQKDISKVELVGVDPSKPSVVEQTRGGERVTTRTPLTYDVEYYEAGELIATGKGTGEEIRTTQKSIKFVAGATEAPTVESVLFGAEQAAKSGDVLLAAGDHKLDLTPSEQKLLAQSIILSRDVEYTPESKALAKAGFKIEEWGQSSADYLTTQFKDNPLADFTKARMKTFVKTPFNIVASVFKAPAGLETLFQSPEAAATNLAFVMTRSGRAIKEDPLGFGGDVLASWGSMKVLSAGFTAIKPKSVTTKITAPEGKNIFLREGGIELEISRKALKSGKSLIDDALGRDFTQPPAPSFDVKPQIKQNEFLGATDDIFMFREKGAIHIVGEPIKSKPLDIGLPSRTTSADPSQLVSIFNFKPEVSQVSTSFDFSQSQIMAPLITKTKVVTTQVTRQVSGLSFLAGASVLTQKQDIKMAPQLFAQVNMPKQKMVIVQTQKFKTSFAPVFMQSISVKQKTKQSQKQRISPFFASGVSTSVSLMPSQKLKMDTGFKFDSPLIQVSKTGPTRRRKLKDDFPKFTFKAPQQYGKLTTKYKPSLTAFAFDVKGKRPKKLFGLEIRPI